jgi:uncharacterized protein (TIGR02594 family)
MKTVIEQAFSQYGVEEQPGENNNSPEIMSYFNVIEQTWVKNDEVAWCSAFINWAAKMTGYEMSDKLTARSWLHIGSRVDNPGLGDVVILWRVKPDSWQGHVGLYITNDENWIWLLGGNQSNKVCIKKYHLNRVLGYRRLNKLNAND